MLRKAIAGWLFCALGSVSLVTLAIFTLIEYLNVHAFVFSTAMVWWLVGTVALFVVGVFLIAGAANSAVTWVESDQDEQWGRM